MASKQSTVDFISDQIQNAGFIQSRKMFGEYALYCNEKVVAFICDDQLFVKPTEIGYKIVGPGHEAPAYPGSKMYLKIDEDLWEDREWLTNLIKQTADVLPMPKPKKKKQSK